MTTITTLYEDDTILALDKPTGLMVHADGRSDEATLVDWIRENYPELEEIGEKQKLQNGEEIARPGIVHRLDRETSGVILVAKTNAMFENLKSQFQDHRVKKEYRAFVQGIIKEDSFTIDRPIGRSATDFRKWSAQRGFKGVGRSAVTDVKVLERLRDTATYIALFPKTGRTHQIRVHMKAVQNPILCDRLYGFKNTLCPKELGRLALHAYSISFIDLDGVEKTVISPVPENFEKYRSAR